MFNLGSYVDGLAVDPVLRRLFYTDFALVDQPQDYEVIYAAIRSMDYDGNNTVDILTENDNLLYPRAIIVDPNLRYFTIILASKIFIKKTFFKMVY